MRNKSVFDFMVRDSRAPTPIAEGLNLAEGYYREGDYAKAARIWQDAADMGDFHATFRLAKLMVHWAGAPMSYKDRLKLAEGLLLKLRKKSDDPAIDLALADVYAACGATKVASALGHLLMAKAAGGEVTEEMVTSYERRLAKQSVEISEDAHGAYILGNALLRLGEHEKGVYFLEQAVAHGEGNWVATAVLELAQACEGKEGFQELHSKYVKKAAELGNPYILRGNPATARKTRRGA